LISLTTAVFLVVGLVTVTRIAIRDHRAARAARRSLFDDCADFLDQSQMRHCGDDFPSLDGTWRGVPIHADLVPDTMTIRRLPQLWLSLTRFEARPGLAEFAVLVRPTGTEFYSLTSQFDGRLKAPTGFPSEVNVRGSSFEAQQLLDRTGPVLAEILRDPKVKEIGVTAKGLRLVWQAGEGRRGEHLLLRQSVFDDANVRAADFTMLLMAMDEINQAVARAYAAGPHAPTQPPEMPAS
jgi:hypothetical protein